METTESGNKLDLNVFWPITLLGGALMLVLIWNLIAAVQQYINGLRLQDQQSVVAMQAAQAEQKMQSMLSELVELGKNNSEAQAIVRKYGITINAPAGGAPSTPRAPDEKATPAKSKTTGGAKKGAAETKPADAKSAKDPAVEAPKSKADEGKSGATAPAMPAAGVAERAA
jgi:hypothetical protein